jgi:hypothetical protein
MSLSFSPSPVVALLAESVTKLSIAESSGDYSAVDASLSTLSSELRRAKSPEAIQFLKPLRELSNLFEQAGCTTLREADLRYYKHSQAAREGAAAHDGVSAEKIENFAQRAKVIFDEILTAQRDAGHIYADTALSKAYCGLMTLYVRHGIGKSSELAPIAQLLQATLDQRLSPGFHARELEWSSHVRAHVTEDIEMDLLLHQIGQEFKAGRPRQGDTEAALYMSHVQRAVNSFEGALAPIGYVLEPVQAYKYAFLFGLISEKRLADITSWEGESPNKRLLAIREFDPEIFMQGAILAARTHVEYRMLGELVPRGERCEPSRSENDTSALCYFGKESVESDARGFVDLTDDYWNIAAPLFTARVLHRDPCAPVRRSTSSGESHVSASSYLAGINYIRDFGRRACEPGGVVV